MNCADEINVYDQDLIPLSLYPYQTILHPIVLCICIPMNLLVGYVLLSNQKLHNARNAIWLGIIASNLSVFTINLLHYLSFLHRHYVICQIISFFYDKPYIVLLINMLLATLDRFVYTRWPLFHLRHVTVCRVVSIQFCGSLAALLGLSYEGLSGIRPIRCGLDAQRGKELAAVVGVLAVSCIVAKLIVYFMAFKNHVIKKRGSHVVIREFILDLDRPPLRAHQDRRTLRRMELNATMSLVANLVPMILIVSSSGLYVLCLSVCQQFFDHCQMLNDLAIYLRELELFHTCTDLLVYVFRSLEFRSAVRNLFLAPVQPRTHL